MMGRRFFGCGVVALAVPPGLGACVSASGGHDGSGVPAPDAFLRHVRPADLGRDLEAAQLVTVTRDSSSLVFEVRLSLEASRFMLVAQDMLGQRLLTVEWTAAGLVDQRAPTLPDRLSPSGFLAELVALCWPEGAVRQALEGTGGTLLVQGNQRIILAGRVETMRGTLGWPPDGRWTGRMSYRNLRAGYSVDVQSVEQS
jgi:hypothetical protein